MNFNQLKTNYDLLNKDYRSDQSILLISQVLKDGQRILIAKFFINSIYYHLNSERLRNFNALQTLTNKLSKNQDLSKEESDFIDLAHKFKSKYSHVFSTNFSSAIQPRNPMAHPKHFNNADAKSLIETYYTADTQIKAASLFFLTELDDLFVQT